LKESYLGSILLRSVYSIVEKPCVGDSGERERVLGDLGDTVLGFGVLFWGFGVLFWGFGRGGEGMV
jgi:hypothetical protein